MSDYYTIDIKIITFEDYLNETGMSKEQVIHEHGTISKYYVYAILADATGPMRCFTRIDTNTEEAVRDAIDTLLMLYYTRW